MLEVSENMILNGIEASEFNQAIKESVNLGKISYMDEFITHFSAYCYKQDAEKDFPPEVFEAIIDEMKRHEFHRLPDSSTLLQLFEHEWSRFSNSQKEMLPAVIGEAFLSRYEDKLSYFVLAEILGEYVANGKALETFETLLDTDNEMAKAFLTYGLGKLAQHADSEKVKKNALGKLRILEKDDSASVRQEAVQALSRLHT